MKKLHEVRLKKSTQIEKIVQKRKTMVREKCGGKKMRENEREKRNHGKEVNATVHDQETANMNANYETLGAVHTHTHTHGTPPNEKNN